MINQMMKKVLQIPVHQLLEAPRQLPLPSVRELDRIRYAVVQQERNEGNNEPVQSNLSQSLQHVDNIQRCHKRDV